MNVTGMPNLYPTVVGVEGTWERLGQCTKSYTVVFIVAINHRDLHQQLNTTLCHDLGLKVG